MAKSLLARTWEQVVHTFTVGSTTAMAVAIVDGSGTQVTSFGGSGGTASTVGSAFPVTATAVGFLDASGNMAGANLDGSGNLKIAGSFSATPTKSATSTLTSVADSASSVTVLAANANRQGAIFYNDSTAAVFLKFGTTASSSSFTKKVLPSGDWDITSTFYTGKVDAIWVSAPGGAMRITELSA